MHVREIDPAASPQIPSAPEAASRPSWTAPQLSVVSIEALTAHGPGMGEDAESCAS